MLFRSITLPNVEVAEVLEVSGIEGGITLKGSTYSAGSQTYQGAVMVESNTSFIVASGDVVFDLAIDGNGVPRDITIDAGDGNVTIETIGGGVRVGAFTVVNGNEVTIGSIRAASIEVGAITAVYGALDTNGSLGIQLTGESISLQGTVGTTGNGPVTIDNSGALVID